MKRDRPVPTQSDRVVVSRRRLQRSCSPVSISVSRRESSKAFVLVSVIFDFLIVLRTAEPPWWRCISTALFAVAVLPFLKSGIGTRSRLRTSSLAISRGFELPAGKGSGRRWPNAVTAEHHRAQRHRRPALLPSRRHVRDGRAGAQLDHGGDWPGARREDDEAHTMKAVAIYARHRGAQTGTSTP
jgi:hypothetical protein